MWIANEYVEDYRRMKQKGVVIKLDLETTYDETDWHFMDYIMARKGFGAKWRSWMYGCLSLAHYLLLSMDLLKDSSRH